MNTLVTLPLLTLICLWSLSSAIPVAQTYVTQGGCCPRLTKTPICKARVKHVAMTPNDCPSKAIVVTAEHQKICLDPNWTWAKKLLAEFENQSNNKMLSFSKKPCGKNKVEDAVL